MVKEATFWTVLLGNQKPGLMYRVHDESVPTDSVLQKNNSGPILMGMFWNGTAH